ncbi:MAG: dihydrofolate reductase [Candidatus Paceibacterota bacterium]
MPINIIAAVSSNKVIGKNGEIPWSLPEDLKHFAKITTGHTVVMGRKTYESIIKKAGKPLPNRKNVVLTSQADFSAPGCLVTTSVSEIIEKTKGDAEVFIIGGEHVYREFLPLAQKIYLTEVDLVCSGDTFFPEYKREEWQEVKREKYLSKNKDIPDFYFLEFIRQ